MKIAFLVCLASNLSVGVAAAQSTNPTSSPAATSTPADTSSAAAAAPSTESAKQKPKEVLATCREEAKSQGLKGDARKTAVQDCFVKQRSDLAGWEKCRTAPEMKGKDKDERKALMKECLKANKS